MRIGILGGTFDPPHSGHLALAKAALVHLELDEILFLPANRNPLKTRKVGTPAKHRLGMVEAMIRNHPHLAVSDMEITRGGPSFTVDTLSELQMVQPADYWFLMGADSLKSLPDWKSPHRLMKLTRLAVVVRPPMTIHDVTAYVPDEFRSLVDMVPMDPVEVSSTDIRERVRRNQTTATQLPPEVLKYIHTHQLYRD